MPGVAKGQYQAALLAANLGLIEMVGVVWWSILGAGVFGSPFSHIQSILFVMHVTLYVITGPLATLALGVTAFWRRVRAGRLLLASSVCNLIIGLPFMSDLGVILPFVISLPMFVIGAWLLLQKEGSADQEPFSWASLCLSLTLFLVGLISGVIGFWFGQEYLRDSGFLGAPQIGPNPLAGYYPHEHLANGIWCVSALKLVILSYFLPRHVNKVIMGLGFGAGALPFFEEFFRYVNI